MENASKALIMAGGVLIGILVLSLAVYIFVDFGKTAAEINSQNEQQQLVAFNSKFIEYENYKDKNGNWQITIYDIITLAGYAKENNEYYNKTQNEKISVNIIGTPRKDNIQELLNNYTSLISQYAYTSNGRLKKFCCESIEYNSNGKVKTINFKTIN